MKIRMALVISLFMSSFIAQGAFAGTLSASCHNQTIQNSNEYLKQTKLFTSMVEDEATFVMNYTFGPYQIPFAYVDSYLAALKVRSGVIKLRQNANANLDQDEVSVLNAICNNKGRLQFSIFN